jgi:hypothetical protein
MAIIQDEGSTANPLHIAGDVHNIGNSNFQITDPSSWLDTPINVGKFAVASVASGVEGIWNTGVMVANALGADAEEVRAADMLASMDSSLSEYYFQNKQSVDVAGFVLSSLIPGGGAVKILNAGSKVLRTAELTGKLGALTRATTGLLEAPDIAKIARGMAQSETAISSINAATGTAIARGFGKAAIESAVFETAAVISLQGSNFVKESTWEDLAKNAATGVLLGGAIGGAIDAIGILGKVKKAVGIERAAKNEERARTALAHDISSSDGLILRLEDLEKKSILPKDSTIVPHTIESINLDIKKFSDDIGGTSHGRALQDAALTAEAREIAGHLQNVKSVGVLNPETKNPVLISLFGDDAGRIVIGGKATPRLGDLFNSVDEAKAAIARYSGVGLTKSASMAGADVLESELRYAAFRAASPESVRITEIVSGDIPALEWAVANRTAPISFAGRDLSKMADEELLRFVQAEKLNLAQALVAEGKSIPEAARAANIKESVLRGEVRGAGDDFFAAQSNFNSYRSKMQAKNLPVDPDALLRPTVGQITYSRTAQTSAKEIAVEQGIVDAYSVAAKRNALAFEAMRAELTPLMGEGVVATLPELGTQQILRETFKEDVGSTLLRTASSTDGLAAKFEYIGKQVDNQTRKQLSVLDDSLLNAAVAVRNNKAAALEFEALNQEVNRTVRKYIPVTHEGKNYFIDAGVDLTTTDLAALIKNPSIAQFQAGARSVIAVENADAFRLLKKHIAHNDDLIRSYAAIGRARGEQVAHLESNLGTFYGIKPDPKKYSHVAFVKDKDLVEGAAGQVTMIHATSAQELEALMQAARNAGSRFDVFDRKSGEIFHQLAADYDRSKTLWRTSVDSSLASKGINSKFFQATDPNAIVDDMIGFHRAAIANKVRNEFAAYYQEAFSTVRGLGEEYARISGSKYGSAIETWLDTKDKNPAFDYIKTALNISKRAEYPVWDGFNTLLSNSFSRAWNGLSGILKETPSPETLAATSAELEKLGAKTAYNDAALEIFRNHRAGGQELTKFVSTVNGALGFLTLRMDPLNALNNVIGANVLLTSNAKSQLKNLKLEGIGDVLSPGKLIFEAQQEFFSKAKPGMDRYIKLGIVPEKDVSVIQQLLDDAAITGVETASELGKRRGRIAEATSKLMKGAEKWSGNLMAEANTRYVSARVAEKIGAARGLGGTELDVFVNGFVNRVNGNLLASQRPALFQGPLGQAIGLFQSYQFNMMQNLLRNVADGEGKTVAMMLGMQTTLYGAKSLPGFDYINNGVIGMASGNKEHRDIYDATYGALGKSGAEALLYGLPSNLLGAGLFSRGDTNPRNLTIIPTSLEQIPIIGATLKMYQNGMDTARNIAGGAGIVNSLVAGIEHNGVSRPLAGVAAMARAFTTEGGQSFSTTGKGTPIGYSDLISWSSAVRMAGGKPFDEAIANDKIYRIGYYSAADKARMLNAAETAKIAFAGNPGAELDAVLDTYLAAGGRQQTFNQWAMKQMLSANTSTTEQMISRLKSERSQKVQQLLGGE